MNRWCVGVIVLCALGIAAVRRDDTKSELERNRGGWKDIMPGPGLKGWTRLPVPVGAPVHTETQVWKVDSAHDLLVCRGDLPLEPGQGTRGGSHEFFRYDKELGDFIFHVEFRFTDPSRRGWNSGIYARNSADGRIWHQAQIGGGDGGYWFGETLDADGKLKAAGLKPTEQRVKPAGEWNTLEITAKGDTMTLWVNGAVTCEWTGLTVKRGFLGLEAEYHSIEFRNLKVKER